MGNKYLVLAGNSQSNHKFASDLCESLSDFGKCEYVKYRHWGASRGGTIDIEEEFNLLKNRDRLNDTMVIAKSAGVVLSLFASKRSVSFKKYYFFGVPFSFAKRLGIDIIEHVKFLADKEVVIMQNKLDPACHYDVLLEKFEGDIHEKMTFVEGSRSDHYYPVKSVVEIVTKN